MSKENVIKQDKTYKIVVVGDICVGKSALICKYTKGIYTNMYRVTIGVDYGMKQVCIKTTEGDKAIETTYNLQLWDIAGQERFGNMSRIYVRESAGAVIVSDITRPQTYQNAVKWKQQIEEHLGRSIPTVLVINKNDLKDTIDKYSEAYPPDIQEFVKDNGFAFYEEISVKNDMEKITNIFNTLIKHIDIDQENEKEKRGKIKTIDLDKPDKPQPQERRKCCY